MPSPATRAALAAAALLVACSADHTGPTAAAGAPGRLAFTLQPAETWVSRPLPAVRVAAFDANGARMAEFAGEVTVELTETDSGVSLGSLATSRASRGTVQFTGLSVGRRGSRLRLRVSAEGVSPGVSDPFDVTPAPVLTFSRVPATFRPDQPLGPTFEVTARDSAGNTVAAFQDYVTLSARSPAGPALLTGNRAALAVRGVATFSDLRLDAEGPGIALLAESPTVSPGRSPELTSLPRLHFATAPTEASTGMPLDSSVRIELRDALGQIVTDFSDTVQLELAPGVTGAGLRGTTSSVGVAGVAVFTGVVIDGSGNVALVATTPRFAGSRSPDFQVYCGRGCWLPRAPLGGLFWFGLGVIGQRLYAVGGGPAYSSPTGQVRVYDPITDRWSAVAPMPTARAYLQVAVVNGVLYAIGGYDDDRSAYLDRVEAYDPATNAWTERAPMPTARGDFGVAVVGGLIYVAGGIDASGGLASTLEVYDPAIDTWVAGPPMPTPRSDLGMAAAGGRIYAVGGQNESHEPLTTVEVLDAATGTWSTGPALPTGAERLGAAVSGGFLYAIGSGTQVQSLNLASGVWTTLAPLPGPVVGPGVAALDGTVYVFGGSLAGTGYAFRP